MARRSIRVGEVWKHNETGETYLVTKLYNEALATMAVLRKIGAEHEALLRVKVERGADGPTIPGFSFALESEER